MRPIFQPTNSVSDEIPSSSTSDLESGVGPEESPHQEQNLLVNFSNNLHSDVTPGQPEHLPEFHPVKHVLQGAGVHDEVPCGRDQSLEIQDHRGRRR